jgi:hypothetical protein
MPAGRRVFHLGRMIQARSRSKSTGPTMQILQWLSTASTIALVLCGCSLASGVKEGSLDYNTVLEDVTDNMLVTNVLLARDQAPLHFTDLSQIRGSLQLQGQLQASSPFGQNVVSTTRARDIVQGTLTVNSLPTFDVVPLNTKEFTEGITTPIDFRFLWYYFNRGADAETVVRLFVSKLDLDENFPANQRECEFINHPNMTFEPQYSSDAIECDISVRKVLGITTAPGKRVTFQDLVPLLEGLDYTLVKKTKEVGPDVRVRGSDLLRSGGLLSGGKISLERGPDTLYHVVKETQESVICLEPTPRHPWIIFRLAPLAGALDRSALKVDPVSACTTSVARPQKADSFVQIFLYMRSVEAIFQYLGQMLTFPEEDRTIPFYIRDNFYDRLVESNPRFRVRYRDHDYFVSSAASSCGYLRGVNDPRGTSGICATNPEYRGDQTLFVLSVLNQVLNLYKNAKEIPITPAVQAVGGP